MTIIRSPRIQRDFTILSNSVCLDPRLSMRALGVLVRLLCRPDNWRTNSEGLAREFGCGRDAVRGALHELQAAGYLKLRKEQDQSGRWSTAWLVFDEPIKQADKTEDGFSGAGESDAGVSDAGKGGAITRTDGTRTDETRTDVAPLTPQGGKRAASKRVQKLTAEDLASEGIPTDQAEAWMAIRHAKRLPLTAGAWTTTKEDGSKTGRTPAETVRECVSRGWAAFRADWAQAQPQRQAESFRERDARLAAERVREATGGLCHDRKATGEQPRELLPFERGYVAPSNTIEGEAHEQRRIR